MYKRQLDYGAPLAPVNPTPSAIDEWYPAIMTEYTYMLMENDPLPVAHPCLLYTSRCV